jgi:uncharacterized protein YneF (UPF0154 family)
MILIIILALILFVFLSFFSKKYLQKKKYDLYKKKENKYFKSKT